MSTNDRRPLPLPESAIPDGCLPLDGDQARRWTQALPAWWVPVRLGMGPLVGVVLAGLLGSGALARFAELPPLVAVLPALALVWVALRPEAAGLLAPPLAVAVLLLAPRDPWWGTLLALLVLALTWTASVLRLAARKHQRAVALAAAGGVTAVPPDQGRTFRRGWLLGWFGTVVAAVGAGGVATVGLGDREVLPAAWLYVTGLGLTAVLSALLGRRRAAALRRAPVPVLRVLVRENADVDAEIYAADDRDALRPLFTVSVTEPDDEDEPFLEPDDDDDDDGAEDDEAATAEFRAVLDRIDSEEPGPLREAVLYGVPYDGAEILLVSADEKPDEPPLTERSQGPVRPLSDRFGHGRLVGEKRAETRTAVYRELHRRAAGAAVAALGSGAVRRWHAGWLDRLTALVLVLWFGYLSLDETGWLWRYALGGLVALGGALLLPRKLAWTVTADSEGLWCSGFRRTHHIAWDHLRAARCKGTEFKLESHRAAFPTWTVHSPRWPGLERRLGWTHPYERAAAEITAMWQDPALRPTVAASARERGRPQWPLAVALGAVFAAALALIP